MTKLESAEYILNNDGECCDDCSNCFLENSCAGWVDYFSESQKYNRAEQYKKEHSVNK